MLNLSSSRKGAVAEAEIADICYLIPISEVAGCKAISLRIAPTHATTRPLESIGHATMSSLRR
jgi:hypothetical protein